MKPRVALVTNILPRYRVPCFQSLSARFQGKLDFFLLTKSMSQRAFLMADRFGDLNVQVLRGATWRRAPQDDVHWNDPRPVLRGYDLIVLSGWDEPTFIELWFLAQIKKTRVAFWVESTYNDAPRNTWKETFKHMLLYRSAGAIAMGSQSSAYCEWLGAPRAKIFVAPNATDSAYFSRRASTLVPQRKAVRAQLELDGVVILFVGRMVDFYKRVAVLLDAQKQLEQKQLDVQLVLVGEGPDRAAYQEKCKTSELRHVRFVNFLEHDALTQYYAAADIFVLPSRSETWGLVINEAMEFGLPIVTTRNVGAAADLVQDNGIVVPPENANALADALEKLVRDESQRVAMGARSREIISRFTPDAWAEGFANALERMLE